MHIGPASIVRTDRDTIRLAAPMNGRELWVEIPDVCPLPDTWGDSFLLMGLAGSMLRGEPLVMDESYRVSAVLVENLGQVQDILHCWNPAFRRVPIEARTAQPSPTLGRVACMYSGGVDSIHALWNHADRVTDAAFVGGFDFDMEDQARASER